MLVHIVIHQKQNHGVYKGTDGNSGIGNISGSLRRPVVEPLPLPCCFRYSNDLTESRNLKIQEKEGPNAANRHENTIYHVRIDHRKHSSQYSI